MVKKKGRIRGANAHERINQVNKVLSTLITQVGRIEGRAKEERNKAIDTPFILNPSGKEINPWSPANFLNPVAREASMKDIASVAYSNQGQNCGSASPPTSQNTGKISSLLHELAILQDTTQKLLDELTKKLDPVLTGASLSAAGAVPNQPGYYSAGDNIVQKISNQRTLNFRLMEISERIAI